MRRRVVLELRVLIAVSLRTGLMLRGLLDTLWAVRDRKIVRLDLRHWSRSWSHTHPCEAVCR